MKSFVQASVTSAGLLVLGLLAALAVGSALAASPSVEAAVKALAKIQADPAKFQTFCKLMQELDAVSDQDTAKADELDAQLESLIKSMGSDVMQAWELAAEVDPASEDGKAFEAAFDALDSKCP